ncbi:gp059 [Rhodococcus phage ReqiPoco6]|uniref:Gp059 n=1 Tax=Rhodococcus phage ReqiPoco6 TaxID=691964 RepID=D4P7S7_9CAUD|nr:gp059 [Rhodococcus phage ReqiPoco6]ADD81057.1 gp059 [Rhodococcus phage ReqiPoco6]
MPEREYWMIPIGDRISKDVKDVIGMRALKNFVYSEGS